MKVIRQCAVCDSDFYYLDCPSNNKLSGGKYCSVACRNKNMSSVLKERGIKPTVRFIATGREHRLWKETGVSYSGIHYWIQRALGKPNLCTHCGTTKAKKFEWANKSKKYKRDIKDWIRLCVSCHRQHDGHSQKAWATRRYKQLNYL